jgi:hypothetical protein
MKYVKRQLKELKSFENNPRVFPQFMFDKLKASIEEFGIVEPLVINKKNEVLGGNQRFTVLIELYGLDYSLDCIYIDYLTSSKERALNIALNRIEGVWDVSKLKDMILTIDRLDLTLTGFSDQELTIFMNNSTTDNLPNVMENFSFDLVIHCINEKQKKEVMDYLSEKGISYK